MDKSSSENEPRCSKDCKKNNDSLNSKIKDLTDELFEANNYIYHYKLAIAQLEGRLVEYKEREVKYIEKIRTLEMYKESILKCIKTLEKELETLKEEKDVVDVKLARLLKSSKDLESIIESQRSDKIKDGVGYNAVPPPAADLYLSPKKDLSWTGLPEFADDTVTDYSRPLPTVESTSEDGQNQNSSAFENGKPTDSILSKPAVKFVKAVDRPAERPTTNEAEIVKKPTVKYAEMYRRPSTKPTVRGNQRNWNNLKTQQLGPDFAMMKKACYNYGDFNHLAYDCRKRVKIGTTGSQNNAYMRPPHRPAGHGPHGPPMKPMRPNMNGARPNRTSFNKQAHSYANRSFQRTSAVRPQYRASWVPTVNRNFPPYVIGSSITTQQTKLYLELVPKEKRIENGKCNGTLNPGKKQRKPTFQLIMDALALTPCYFTFLTTADVLEVYMHQFQDSIHKYDTSYMFRMDKKKKFNLNLEIFRDILQICHKVHEEGKMTVEKHKGINLFSQVALTKKAQYKEGHKKSLREFHKTHPSGSGIVTSATKIKPSVINKGAGAKPGVPDVTKKESTESKAESWGRDEDDSNNDHDTSSEGDDQESDSGDVITQSDKENGLESEHENDENETGSESNQDENKEEVEDDEEEKDDEFVKTSSNSTHDEDETNEESKVEDKAEVNTNEWFIQKEDTGAEMINVQQGNENLEITLNQVIEDGHVTWHLNSENFQIFLIQMQKLFLQWIFMSIITVLVLEKEVAKLKKDDLLNTQVTALVDEHLDSILKATRDEFMSYLLASITARITQQVKIQFPQILPKKVSNFTPLSIHVEELEFKVIDSDMPQDHEENLGPSFKILKGTRTNFVELEYDFEECYKALSEKLDWDNPEGGTRVKVMKIHRYGYLRDIEVRRTDNELHTFKERDFLRLCINDIEDMLILVIQNRLMRSDELYKFSDGTLIGLRTSLDDITKNIRMDYLPQRRWSSLENKRAHIMIKAIDKQLKERRMMWSFEMFVRGRHYETELWLLQRTI
nr:ubiquitin hydrolase [Tanacetum cinerariifolium]